jgi:hypothetical protein
MPRGKAFDGERGDGRKGAGLETLEDMHLHGVARRVVQDQREVIEAHDVMKPVGQRVEQRGEIAVRDDRFRHREQGSVSLITG